MKEEFDQKLLAIIDKKTSSFEIQVIQKKGVQKEKPLWKNGENYKQTKNTWLYEQFLTSNLFFKYESKALYSQLGHAFVEKYRPNEERLFLLQGYKNDMKVNIKLEWPHIV